MKVGQMNSSFEADLNADSKGNIESRANTIMKTMQEGIASRCKSFIYSRQWYSSKKLACGRQRILASILHLISLAYTKSHILTYTCFASTCSSNLASAKTYIHVIAATQRLKHAYM